MAADIPASVAGILDPDELEILQAIVGETCAGLQMPRNCDKAQHIARVVLAAYRGGVHDGDRLRRLAAQAA